MKDFTYAANNLNTSGDISIPAGALRFLDCGDGKKLLQMYCFIFASDPETESSWQWVVVPLVKE